VSEISIEEQLQEAKDDLAACERANAELEDIISEKECEIERLTENFDYALQALRANRIKDALHELEKALPDEFIGFAETIIKWSKKA
jgi:predicted  nucleic acid-binding Zn-ribbon protein